MYRRDATTSSGCGCGGGGVLATPTRSGSVTGSAGCGCGCGQCDACDGLTCLCRPRFYDGQLVTAADFNRLDQYIVAKNRLRNRYLHGVGVVCGLEVVCNPCDDTVTLRPGYALGPCGEDIVVCHDTRVDVARLVKDQRAARARTDCGPYIDPAKDCEAARQKWVLGICYDELPARPMASLKRSGGSCGGSCGGACGGSCSPAPTAPVSCEPTQICEGFRFSLTRVPAGGANDRTPPIQGELPRRVMECLTSLSSGLTRVPDDPSGSELVTFCCDLKADLRDLIETGNVHDCTLGQRLGAIVCPDPDDDQADQKARSAIAAMLQVAIDLFRDCVCSALLPPCADGFADDCVPLAVLTVRSSDLRVLDICNWSARKFAVTMPALSYWLGWIPVFAALRQVIERLCCEQTRRPSFALDKRLRVAPLARTTPVDGARDHDDEAAAPERPAEERQHATMAGDPAAFVGLGEQYAKAWSSLSGLESTVLGALGARATDGQDLASPLELDNPLAALSLGRLGVGAVSALLPPDLARRVGADIGAAREPEQPEQPEQPDEDRLAALEEAVAKLTKTVSSQARTIRTLRAKGQGR